jgi:hypothetical protein
VKSSRPDSVCPSRVLGAISNDRWGFPLLSDPHGLLPPYEAITELVAAISGLQLPPRRFYGLAVFRGSVILCRDRSRSSGNSRRIGRPFRAFRQRPAGVLRGSGDPHGVLRPYNDINAEIYSIRVSNPGMFRLQGFSPS